MTVQKHLAALTAAALLSTAPCAFAAAPAAPAATQQQLDKAETAFEAGRAAEAVAIWQPLAEAGNAQAQARLGKAYYQGRGVQQDYAQAVQWFEKAAAQGSALG